MKICWRKRTCRLHPIHLHRRRLFTLQCRPSRFVLCKCSRTHVHIPRHSIPIAEASAAACRKRYIIGRVALEGPNHAGIILGIIIPRRRPNTTSRYCRRMRHCQRICYSDPSADSETAATQPLGDHTAVKARVKVPWTRGFCPNRDLDPNCQDFVRTRTWPPKV